MRCAPTRFATFASLRRPSRLPHVLPYARVVLLSVTARAWMLRLGGGGDDSQATYETLDRVGRECLAALEQGLAVQRPGVFTEVLDDPPGGPVGPMGSPLRPYGGPMGEDAARTPGSSLPQGSQTTLRLLHYDRVHTAAAATAQVKPVGFVSPFSSLDVVFVARLDETTQARPW